MMKVLIAIALVFGFSAIAIGQDKAEPKAETKIESLEMQDEAKSKPEGEAKAEGPIKDMTNVEVKEEVFIDADWGTKLGAYLFALYMFLWGLGEALTRVSVYTKTKWDNKAAAWISQILWFIGSFAGRMGWKLPKEVIKKEAVKIAEKEKKKASA